MTALLQLTAVISTTVGMDAVSTDGPFSHHQVVGTNVPYASAVVQDLERPQAAFGYGSNMKTHGINHVALYVDDLARSRDFYLGLFEATVVREDEGVCFLDVGADNFLALFARDPAHINHFCFTIDDYEPDTAASALESRGLEVIRREDRVFTRDPDGHLVQVSGPATAEDFSG